MDSFFAAHLWVLPVTLLQQLLLSTITVFMCSSCGACRRGRNMLRQR